MKCANRDNLNELVWLITIRLLSRVKKAGVLVYLPHPRDSQLVGRRMTFVLQREHWQELQAVQEQLDPQELQTEQAQAGHRAATPEVGI